MSEVLKVHFAPAVSREQQSVIYACLSRKPDESQRILHNHRSQVKAFYRVESAVRPLFVKYRFFRTWHRRLGRTLQRTKEERELANYLTLVERNIPCPEPIGSGRLYDGPLIKESLLILEFLSDALPLSALLRQPEAPTGALLDGLIALLHTLRVQGGIHEDLQWNNVMGRLTPAGPQLFLIDPLHLRWTREAEQESFRKTVVWFLHFLLAEHAPATVVEGFLQRVGRLGIGGPGAREALLEEARRART
jgi:hypothetical protein